MVPKRHIHAWKLQVYSWEPLICHDVVDMGWSTLGDQCINDKKLLACSYYRNSIGVWVGNVSVLSAQVEFVIYIDDNDEFERQSFTPYQVWTKQK